MRVGVSTIIVGVLSVAIVLVLLGAPFANIQERDNSGQLLRDETVGFDAYHEERIASANDGQPTETVPGTGHLYMLVPAVLLAIAGAVFTLVHLVPGRPAQWTVNIAGLVTGISALMVLHANALWAGKGIAQAITNYSLGSDGPPRTYKRMTFENSPVDVHAVFLPISAFILVALSLVLLGMLGQAWLRNLPEARGVRDGGRRHARLMLTMAGLFTLLLVVPMVVQTLPDGLRELGADRDTYYWSPQEIMFLRDVSWNEAKESGEAGLILWDGLDLTIGLAIVVLMAGVIGPMLGLAGKHMEAMDQSVLGRLLENVSLVAIISALATLVSSVLAAFVLHHANDAFESTTTGIPLIIGVGAILAIVHGGFVARHVLQDDSDIVADDFPEPVVYD